MKTYQQMLLANRAWAREFTELDPHYFQRQTAGERPDIFWVGSSDSRVSPEQLTQRQPGEIFLHRNIANLVELDDLNFMSTLQYAVDHLRVSHIIVCGNYGCGGIHAVMEGNATGPMAQWLKKIGDVFDRHADDINAQPEGEARENRLVELNVCAQLYDIARTEVVRRAFAEPGRDLQLHGWVYDIRDGLIKPLLEIDAQTDLSTIEKPPQVLAETVDPA